jgi:hypothetical protein
MDRSPKAALSPREFKVLRALKQGSRDISDQDRRLLLSMGLAVDEGEAMRVSPAGLSRLVLEERESRGGY